MHPPTAPRPAAARLTTGSRPAGTPLAVSPHHLASSAALEIMGNGGSAVDGAIAADAVLGVVAPDTCGIGGDLFALVHIEGDETPAALNASGRAGSGLGADALRNEGHTEMPLRHPATVTVPGCIDGWEALAEKFGRLSLATVLEPALHLAEMGFPVSHELAASLRRIHSLIGDQPSAPPLYPAGGPPAAGTVIRRPHLASTLRGIAEGGRAGFYEGEVATAITAATSGIVTSQDLQQPQAEWVAPLGTEVFGQRAWTVPPNSQGYLTLAAVRVLEHLRPPPDPTDPAFVHACIEAYRSVAWERDGVVTDPSSAPHAPEWYLDPDRLRERAATVDRDRAGVWPAAVTGTGGTAFLCTTDGAGMSVSFIQSNFHGIGSGISAGKTGVFLHNRGAGFSLQPGHPNEWQPGRRPLHTLSPTLWTTGTTCTLVLGTRGGAYQPQLLLQMAANLLYGNLGGAEAQAAPRWQVQGFTPGAAHNVRVEASMPPPLVDGLRRRGHRVEEVAGVQAGWGPISLIAAGTTERSGFADPRVSTSAALAG